MLFDLSSCGIIVHFWWKLGDFLSLQLSLLLVLDPVTEESWKCLVEVKCYDVPSTELMYIFIAE